MRVRADQVRVGQRLCGAEVTRVRPALNWGTVRITVRNATAPGARRIPDGTFSYLPDDLVEVEAPEPGPAASSTPARGRGLATTLAPRPGATARS